MKNNNARINDFLKACERKGYLIKQNSSDDTQRTLRQRVKHIVGEYSECYAHFEDFHVHLTIPLSGSKSYKLPPELAEDFAILTGQPSRERIEIESEIIAGSLLLGAKYLGEGKFTTPCGVTFQVSLDKPVTAQQVRDSVIFELCWEIQKIQHIHLTRI